ncbi:hypothetical protein [Nocardioides sp. zg-1230]|uniref:hypothetical protein n=1 Tax=Nocardioides sp. zg-1230 TaxID=2736601 RepID=UPI0015557299|nr:hypothetical protein [Nocardioides sp. zg-1230]NPC42935.1 hypothetical protein [Nocardioides sp. zg-1230]
MTKVTDWDSEVFAALLPLALGGFALWVMQGDGWWAAVVKWVSEGTLMVPAVLLCFAMLRRSHHFESQRARKIWNTVLVVATGAVLVIFVGSVQPGQRAHTQTAFAAYNAVLYAVVVGFCVTVAKTKVNEVDA